ncbi:C45 family peptidase [Novosphingobium sp. P6W]|uniref:C45 family autoproteolytic acyltransferase/hydolase n=1 Tax=Novosphingobium sp. P6W TaxID=1609758 RepID=UPI0005C2CB20|nr:C45 family peptidase [Novosphingobium sp. P6W]AXB78893.1 hypothetical protein TQ38_020130 [Novosphingobium sp. P6W]KIS29576.1 hypothetical protein TQ38_28145 [Novosphingobium sp. P6W]
MKHAGALTVVTDRFACRFVNEADMILDVIDLSGSPSERGRAFGNLRRAQIRSWLDDWLESLALAGISDPRAYAGQFIRNTEFMPTVEAYASDVLDELRAMAEGADVPFELLFAAQLMDEEWVYREATHGSLSGDKCSSFAIRAASGSMWIGQNMDLDTFTDGHQLMVRASADGGKPATLVFTVGGLIALLGVNARRVAICVNYLSQLPTSARGLPVAFVIRKSLQSNTLDEAARFIKSVPHAVGQHYLIADTSDIRSLEASAAGVHEFSAGSDRVLHTNHPLAPANIAIADVPNGANSEARLSALTRRLGGGFPGLSELQAALSSSDDPLNPVCRTAPSDVDRKKSKNINGFTTGSVIMSLDRRKAEIDAWVSNGPPSLRGYEEVRLNGVN